MTEGKPFCISKWAVFSASTKVRANQGASGVDGALGHRALAVLTPGIKWVEAADHAQSALQGLRDGLPLLK